MMKELGVGDKMPVFELQDQDNNLVKSIDLVGNKHLILFFYPKASTPGCTKEACKFRDEFADFADANAKVVGISNDSPKAQKTWATKNQLPFTLLCDKGNSVRKQFGVKGSLFGIIPGRVTFIIDRQGVIQHVFSSQMNYEQHVSEALEALKEM